MEPKQKHGEATEVGKLEEKTPETEHTTPNYTESTLKANLYSSISFFAANTTCRTFLWIESKTRLFRSFQIFHQQ
jgi:hypothetical protein